jgi:hypothetical protein
VQKYNENVFINTLGPTFQSNEHQSSIINHAHHLTLSNDLNKIAGMHFTIHIKIYMLVELCAGNCDI